MAESEQAEEVTSTADSNHSDNEVEGDVLSIYEDLFKHRFTELDEEYTAYASKPLADPPCVENWYSRPKRTYDWTRGQRPDEGRGGYRGHDRGHHQGRSHYSDHSQGHHQGYHRDRDHGHQQRHSHGPRHYDRGNEGQGRRYDNDRYGQGRDHSSHQGQGSGRRDDGRQESPRVAYAGARDNREQRSQNRYHPYGQNQGQR